MYPQVRSIHCIRENNKSTWAIFANKGLKWNTRAAFLSSDTPRRASDGRGAQARHLFPFIWQATQEHPQSNHGLAIMGRNGKDCWSTVRCTSMEPTDTNNQNTTHTPTLTPSQHHQMNHTPYAKEQTSKWKHQMASLKRC